MTTSDFVLVDDFIAISDWAMPSGSAEWGQSSLHVKHAGAALFISGQGDIRSLRRPAPGMHPGRAYTALAWVYVGSGQPVSLSFQMDAGTVTHQQAIFNAAALDPGWNRLVMSFQVPSDWPDNLHLRFWRTSTAPGADTWWSSLRVIEQEEMI